MATDRLSIDKTLTVYVVDDDLAVRDSLRVVLETYGMVVREYDSAKDFLADQSEATRGCVLLDIRMPEMSGLELLEVLRERRSQLPTIILTGCGDANLWEQAERAGALAMLSKPIDIVTLVQTIERAVASKEPVEKSDPSYLGSTGIRRVIREAAPTPKVLIAEDQLLIADQLEETLTASGYEVCGIARTVDEGVALAQLHKPDFAVLDIRLAKGGRGPEIARRLDSEGKCGVLYATGYDARNSSLTRDDGVGSISKPYRAEDVVRALAIVREVATTGIATSPFPSGFRLLHANASRVAQVAPQ